MKTIIQHRNSRPCILALCCTAATAFGITFNTNTSIPAGSTAYEGQDVVVSGCTVTINGPHHFASLLITNAGVVTHAAATTGEADNVLNLTIAGNLGVDALSRIDLAGRGYGPLNGPGAGTPNPGGWGRGAGHGGEGGTAVNYGGAGGGIYGSITTPSQWGSGGGGASGGAGGGVAILNVTGSMRVDGVVTTDGLASPSSFQQGGGAGGSVQIYAGTLTGGGSITARGGAGGIAEGGGAGGGGRIAFYFTTNTFSGIISAAGAAGYQNAGAGTLYSKSTGESVGRVTVDNGGMDGLWTTITTPGAFGLVIRNKGKARASTPLTLGSLLVQSTGVLSCPQGSTSLSVTVQGNAGIDTGGRMDVNGLGYDAELGPGAGERDGGGWGPGAGHGGVGGYSFYRKPGGGAYDSIMAPTMWGSGGGSSNGGAGGGAIMMTVGGGLRVDGVLAADGLAGADCCAQHGGGAGGSLRINVGTLTGAGSITARGGNGGTTQGGGAGGGGRIALYFAQNTFAGSLTAAGGEGFQNGGAGTVYTKASAESTGHLLVDNGGLAGEWTPLTSPEPFQLVIGREGRVHAIAPLELGSLLVRTAGTLSSPPGAANLNVTVQGNAGIDAGGRVHVNGLGYAAEEGPGAGQLDPGGWGPGAGHGGVGGYSFYQKPGGLGYDSITAPALWGSGGGGSLGIGGAGGGAIWLTVGGAFRVDGVLSADGLSPANVQNGGGAGGSLRIKTGTLTGGGLISARGGAAGVTQGGGGGGGGRIAAYYAGNTFNGSVSAAGGVGFQNGGAGTIFTKSGTATYGKVLVDNEGNAGLTRLNRADWPAGLAFDLTLSGASILKADVPQLFHHVLLTGGALVTLDQSQTGFHWTCMGDLSISGNSAFDADGMGYAQNLGPGTGSVALSGYGSGAGHGGSSAMSYFESNYTVGGGGTYGSITEPVALGSGGGSNPGAIGGSGGGALRLTVDGTLQLDGSIKANGRVASDGAGSGSGGSLWITAHVLSGGGSITAAGGAASPTGAAGGGGRIALYTGASQFTGTVSASSNGTVHNGTSLLPVEVWRQTWFGSTAGMGNAAPDADPNQNGIPNRIEYALQGDPTGGTTGTGILPVSSLGTTGRLQLTFNRTSQRRDVTLTVQAHDALSGTWTDLASSLNGGAFSIVTNGATVSETGTGNARTCTIGDLYPGSDPAHSRRFLRLLVSTP